MRILIYSVNFAPEPTGIGKFSGEMAEWFADRGHEVRAVVAPPYYPKWKVDAGYRWPPFRRETWRGVKVWRAPLWVPQSPGGTARVLHLLTFAITSFPLMIRQIFWQPDLVIAVAPAFVCAPTALLTARLSRARAWLHVQDFEVDIAFRMGLLRGGLIKRMVLQMERALLRRFNMVSTISGRMIEHLLTKGVSAENTRYFPNWVDISRFNVSRAHGRYRAELNISADAVVALFSGSLGGKQGLMVIPEAARLLTHREDIVFVICGDGIMRDEVKEASAGLANFRMLPLQPLERLGELLATADIHLLTQSPNAADLVLPSKVSGMLASGRPVVATCQTGTEISEIVSNCGIVVPPKDSEALAAAIAELADNAARRQELGHRAREFAEMYFERDAVLTRMIEPLENETPTIVARVVV